MRHTTEGKKCPASAGLFVASIRPRVNSTSWPDAGLSGAGPVLTQAQDDTHFRTEFRDKAVPLTP